MPVKRKGKWECEMCGEMVVHSVEFTVCNDCDKQLEKEQGTAMQLIADKWAAKRKCQECGKGLAPSRYFTCEDCLNDCYRPTDDIFLEAMDDWNMEEAVTTRPLLTTPKQCRTCKETKERIHFTIAQSIWGKETHSIDCRPCQKIIRDRYKASKRVGACVV